MTGTEIKNAAEKYIEEEIGAIDDTDALVAINEALRKMGDVIPGSGTVVATADTWTAAPTGAVSIVEVNDSDGEIYTNYRFRHAQMIFGDSDTYTVFFRKLATEITALAGTITGLHDAFKQALVTYVKAWCKLKDDEENPDGLKLLKDFELDLLHAKRLVFGLAKGTAEVKVVR